MKKILLIILSAVIALSMTACNVSTQSSENVDSGTDIQTESSENGSNSQEISSIERSEDITDTSADENLLLDANILSGYLALCLDTNTTPETPKFNYAQFLIKCAVEGQKDFCYYNRFFRVNEQNGNYRFDYDTVKKLKKRIQGSEKQIQRDGKSFECLTFEELSVYLNQVEDEIE